MDQKIIFFDIDGTLFMPDIGVPKSTIVAIEKLLENNHIPVLSTGRANALIPQSLIDIGFKGIIAAAGADVTFENKVIHQVVEGTEAAKKMGDLLYEGNLAYILEGPEYIYYDRKQALKIDEYVDNAIKDLGMERFKPIDEGDVVYNKISSRINEDSVIHPLIKEKYEIIHHSKIDVIELVPKGYNKAVGIKKMIEYLGIDRKNTYAFGDSNNDIEMLDYVEYGVAMGNAYPEILERAKYKTKSIYEDGIYYGLKELGLL